MKDALRKLFNPILAPLESGSGRFAYKPSHRAALWGVSALFSLLAVIVLILAQGKSAGYLFPALVFGALGLGGIIVAALGDDRAVASVWGNKERE